MKDNQPALKEAIATAFDAPHAAAASAHERRLEHRERQTAASTHKGHGRLERRRLTRTIALNKYLDWPDVQQVFKIDRTRTIKGQSTRETAYGITSLRPDQADAARLLQLVRGHWGIENRLFCVRDTTFGEDACRVRTGFAPQNLAALRNVSISLLNIAGCTNKAAALRRHAAHPHEALALVRPPPEN